MLWNQIRFSDWYCLLFSVCKTDKPDFTVEIWANPAAARGYENPKIRWNDFMRWLCFTSGSKKWKNKKNKKIPHRHHYKPLMTSSIRVSACVTNADVHVFRKCCSDVHKMLKGSVRVFFFFFCVVRSKSPALIKWCAERHSLGLVWLRLNIQMRGKKCICAMDGVDIHRQTHMHAHTTQLEWVFAD